MNCLLAVMLVPLHFTAPADTIEVNRVGQAILSTHPVHTYVFQKLDSNGSLTPIPGFADSTGRRILLPHVPGTRETVWLVPGENGTPVTVYMLSRDARGNTSTPSNGCVIAATPGQLAMHLDTRHAGWTTLKVPIVRQASRARCGQAALVMVLRYYGAAPSALQEVDAAYDPVLRGSLITDLAGAARRAGYEASIATLTSDSLIALLNDGVPPILLYQNGRGPLTVRHFGVVTGWDATQASFMLHDGTARARVARRNDLEKRWETAGSQALIVRQRGQ
jgi:hypothetical protein